MEIIYRDAFREFQGHVQAIRRVFPSGMQVSTIGYVAQKEERVQHAFESCNFSFIFSGSGTYHYRGKVHQVHPGTVLTQTPGEPMDYGPDSTWEELFLIYPEELHPILKSRGLIPDEPLWQMRNSSRINRTVLELAALLEDPSSRFNIDRIDRVCEQLVMEGLIHRTSARLSEEEEVIRQLEQYVSTRFLDEHDFDALARDHGLHPAKFRRLWNRYIGTPPVRYQMQLRMAEAARLVVETDMRIGEIARALGFNDELYFSKRFRSAHQLSATEYRDAHRREFRGMMSSGSM